MMSVLPDGEEQNEETGVGKDGLYDLGPETVLVDAQGEDGARMENAAKLVADDFYGREHAHHLDAAGRTARTRADDAHDEEDDPREVGPDEEIFGGETGGTHQ